MLSSQAKPWYSFFLYDINIEILHTYSMYSLPSIRIFIRNNKFEYLIDIVFSIDIMIIINDQNNIIMALLSPFTTLICKLFGEKSS